MIINLAITDMRLYIQIFEMINFFFHFLFRTTLQLINRVINRKVTGNLQ